MKKGKNRKESRLIKKISWVWRELLTATRGRGSQIGNPLYRRSVRISWRDR